MPKEEIMKSQKEYLDKMVKNLPVLRASIRITQRELAKKIGVTSTLSTLKLGIKSF